MSERRLIPVEGPVACTLDEGSLAGRLDEWHAVLDRVAERQPIDGGVRLVFDAGADLREVARLMEAEQRCCAFFAFALTVDGRGVALEVRAPEDAADVVAALFGEAANGPVGR